MTLPANNPKAYLQLVRDRGGVMIQGQVRHVAELDALFRTRGIPCSRGDYSHGRGFLRLAAGADLGRAGDVLEEYKAGRGG